MKQLLFVIMLVLGMGILFSSCEKEGLSSNNGESFDIGLLEGKEWVIDKIELYLNGSKSGEQEVKKWEYGEIEFSSLYFINGKCIMCSDYYSIWESSFTNNSILLTFEWASCAFFVLELSNKQLVLDSICKEEISIKDATLVDTINGEKIYKDWADRYYYINKDGIPICCEKKNSVYYDTQRITLKAK